MVDNGLGPRAGGRCEGRYSRRRIGHTASAA